MSDVASQGARELGSVQPRLDREGLVWLNRRYEAPLARAGMTGFDEVMAGSRGHCMRVLQDRENWYVQVDGVSQQPLGMYLKKHRIRTCWTIVRALLGLKPSASAGRIEAENVESIAALDIDVPSLVAFGERLSADGQLESFVLTEELEGYCELQEFVRRRFRTCADRGVRRDSDLRRLIRQVAAIARRFHAAGYNHRDFYCCHFLTKEPSPGNFAIRLIDLHRVQRRRWFRRRWIVKDLAQLAYMLPADRISCRDKLTFLHDYLGVRRLRPQDKRLIRAVLWKQRFMAWRQRRKS